MASTNIADFPWPAPAKLNLFLHITGRRDDGYHLLQTLFQFIDYGDTLYFQPRADGRIHRATELPGVSESDDLVVRAARLLQTHGDCRQGVSIRLEKRLPMGGGLGGGSSDAATTLVALNRLWGLGLSTDTLAELGLSLGADVPVFVRGQAAWAEGVGEQLTPVHPDEPWYLVLAPPVHVDTGEIFSSPELTRDKQIIKIRDLSRQPTENVCQPVVAARYPEVAEAIAWLNQHAEARMTGTGACVFAAFANEAQARQVAEQAPPRWQTIVAKGCNTSPLMQALDSSRRLS